MPNKSKIRVAGQIVWGDESVFIMPSEEFTDLPIGEQWLIMRAAQRAIDRIASNLAQKSAEHNRNLAYEEENESDERNTNNK